MTNSFCQTLAYTGVTI